MMTKKEYCLTHETVAYHSNLKGIEIKGIEYGIEDYIYCVSGAWGDGKGYHKVKIKTTATGNSYFNIHGYRIPLDERIRTGV